MARVRDSGMPGEGRWEHLFDVGLTLDRLGIGPGLGDVAELGCGYGTFTVPVAQRITGILHAFDIDEAMVARTRERVASARLNNAVVERRDVLGHGFGLPSGSQDGCLLFNILHHEDPVVILSAAAGILRPGGLLFITHWRHDGGTPRGPRLDIRPRPEDVTAWAGQAGGLELVGGILDLPPWHYGLVLEVTSRSK